MWAVSDQTVAAYQARGDLSWRVDLLVGGAAKASVPVLSGGINVDETATNRRTLSSLKVADPEDWLPLIGGLLEPTGNELAVYAAALNPDGSQAARSDGTTDWAPCGVFGIRKPTAVTSGGVSVTIDGKDRSQRVADVQIRAGYTIPAGTNVADAIADLIDDGVPGLPRLFALTTATVAAVSFAEGDDRWKQAAAMAASAGMELFFDAGGTLILRDVRDPSVTIPSWTYKEGPGSLLTSITQAVDADQTYSHAIAVGQSTDPSVAPVRGDAYDNNPASPTYYLGPFGDRQVRLVSPFITGQGQADAAAAGLLRRKQGLLEDLTSTGYQVVAHEAGDVVVMQSSTLGVNAHYALSKFGFTIGPGLATLTTRARRTTT